MDGVALDPLDPDAGVFVRGEDADPTRAVLVSVRRIPDETLLWTCWAYPGVSLEMFPRLPAALSPGTYETRWDQGDTRVGTTRWVVR